MLSIPGCCTVYVRNDCFTTQIGSCIEACLKALGIDLAVFVQNVCIDLSDHVRLCVARIALCCLYISPWFSFSL